MSDRFESNNISYYFERIFFLFLSKVGTCLQFILDRFNFIKIWKPIRDLKIKETGHLKSGLFTSPEYYPRNLLSILRKYVLIT